MTKLCIKILVKSDSAIESAFPLHCGQYHISTGRETMPCCYVFLCSHRRRLSVCKEDFSLTLEMTMRESDVSSSLSHKSLTIRPCFQIFGVAISRIVIPSAAERSFLHCGQYHIGTAGKRRLGAAHILCLSVCMEDFSLALEMTIRGLMSPSLLVFQSQPSHQSPNTQAS